MDEFFEQIRPILSPAQLIFSEDAGMSVV